MATSRNIFLGKPPFEFLARHLAKDEDFRDDTQCILKLDQDAYNRLVTQLAKTDAFLDRSSLTALAIEVLGEGEEAHNIASVIYRIGGMLHDADMPAQEAINELGKAIQEKADGIEQSDRQILTDRLRALVADPVGLAKQYKARQLVDATGSELDEIQLICDIRPIFDQGRERIEGAMPITTMRLDYSAPDGESNVIEVRITAKQIEEFGTKIETVKSKLKLIKKLLTSQNLPIPTTESAVTDED